MDATTQSKIITQVSPKEKFWDGHVKLSQLSNLSKAAYCRKHELDYDQFMYWQKRVTSNGNVSQLLPVKLSVMQNNTPEVAPNVGSITTLCALAFKNGVELNIYNKDILPTLLSCLGVAYVPSI